MTNEQIDIFLDESLLLLKARLDGYVSKKLVTKAGDERRGVKAFCDEHKISSSNLLKALDPKDPRQFTYDQLVKVAKGLGVWPQDSNSDISKKVLTSSLKGILKIQIMSVLVFLSSLRND